MDKFVEELRDCIAEFNVFQNHYLNLNVFSILLYDCLEADGYRISHWHDLYNLFIGLIDDKEQSLVRVTSLELSADTQGIYPGGKVTEVCSGLFLKHYHMFVQNIGYVAELELDPPEDHNYNYWLTKKFENTFRLLNKLSLALIEITESNDSTGKYSQAVQAMSLSAHTNQDLEHTLQVLLQKGDSIAFADERIRKAIGDGYYLEAIALQESRIADRLCLNLGFNGRRAHKKAFANLIEENQKELPHGLPEQLDKWRRDRNKFLHQMVRSDFQQKQIAAEDFQNGAKQAAITGSELVEKIECWFRCQVYREQNPFRLRFAEG
ncbi:hypothetical protein AHAT_23130 [Agarivorans sp. Toyoura001]|uniref:hypothetical protein n=1 Tax=Agarivorans sp. Toyoura001 TaxID=2283141 RepID=UPI0010D71DFD|nr:hypothetical protein [Agarivorans sp. Toyoura001]GDY26423.1 hypothetical protein AHAT_23130 [Agarivorans sp. Toyoura001]